MFRYFKCNINSINFSKTKLIGCFSNNAFIISEMKIRFFLRIKTADLCAFC